MSEVATGQTAAETESYRAADENAEKILALFEGRSFLDIETAIDRAKEKLHRKMYALTLET